MKPRGGPSSLAYLWLYMMWYGRSSPSTRRLLTRGVTRGGPSPLAYLWLYMWYGRSSSTVST